jgi:cell wall-associated NlpC family hydrolase
MQKTTEIVPVIIVIIFMFNCCLDSTKLIAKSRPKTTNSSEKISSNTSQFTKTSQSQNLKVTSLLPEEYQLGDYKIKSVSLTSKLQDDIMTEITQWLDTRYKWGGKSENGIDCSGFTSMIYEKVIGIQIPRSSVEQMKIGTPVNNINELQFGDLVFFTSGKRNPGHVGIYIENGQFVHASSYKQRGVVTSMLIEGNYLKRYVGARRILNEPTIHRSSMSYHEVLPCNKRKGYTENYADYFFQEKYLKISKLVW